MTTEFYILLAVQAIGFLWVIIHNGLNTEAIGRRIGGLFELVINTSNQTRDHLTYLNAKEPRKKRKLSKRKTTPTAKKPKAKSSSRKR